MIHDGLCVNIRHQFFDYWKHVRHNHTWALWRTGLEFPLTSKDNPGKVKNCPPYCDLYVRSPSCT